jgi:Ca2+-binding RTX toxin-like protein
VFEKLTLTGGGAINGTGNSANNTVTGNTGGNTLSGLGGDDTLNGGTSADRMSGGTGNDTTIVDNVGDVVLEAEAFATLPPGTIGALGLESGGIDTVLIQTTGEAFAFTLPDFVEIMIGDALNNVLLIDADRATPGTLLGGIGRDTLRGGAGGDLLDGQDGNDRVEGRDGNDTLLGGSGNDSLFGGKGHDTIDGGAGNDVLVGNQGHDTLIGGGGNDTFKFTALADGTTVAGNKTPAAAGVVAEAITDFVAGADGIAVLKSVFDPEGTLGLGPLDASNFTVLSVAYRNNNVTAGNTVSGTRVAWSAGDPSFVVDANEMLIYDPNGAASGYTVLADLGEVAPSADRIAVVAT